MKHCDISLCLRHYAVPLPIPAVAPVISMVLVMDYVIYLR